MISIRAAQPDDAPLLSAMIHEFADYQQLEATVVPESLRRDGFGPHAKFRTLIAEWSGQPAGYAIFYDCYETYDGAPGIFLEDIFVREPLRKHGVGKALLARVAAIAQQQGHCGLRFNVLRHNQNASSFYAHLGAKFLDEWRAVLVKGDALRALAAQAPPFRLAFT
jgi:GNAT superfamily N-acetyltransferase